MRKIIMFGGAFNPPLNSHFLLAQQIVNEIEDVDKIIFIPVNINYEKKEAVIASEHRYNMLKLVCDKNEKFEVSRIEIDSNRPLYTIETLDILQKKYPEHQILFATGTDNLKEFDTWEGADKITAKYKVLVLSRDNDNIEEKYKNVIHVKLDTSNLSSTEIRSILETKNYNLLKSKIDKSVLKYIVDKNLY